MARGATSPSSRGGASGRELSRACPEPLDLLLTRPVPLQQGSELLEHGGVFREAHRLSEQELRVSRAAQYGEQPRQILVGADPAGLHHANAAAQAYEFVGSPEGHLALAQATLYLALCPKSNSVYEGYARAARLAQDLGPLAVPLKIRNAPTDLMSQLEYGKGYSYPHASPGHWLHS